MQHDSIMQGADSNVYGVQWWELERNNYKVF
jgi:hypothetical protein